MVEWKEIVASFMVPSVQHGASKQIAPASVTVKNADVDSDTIAEK